MSDKKPICVIGNLVIDLIIRQVPHLPKWGTEVVGANRKMYSAGQAAALSFGLSKLGVPVNLIANVGVDTFGDQILDDLRRFKIDTSVVEANRIGQTGISVAIVRQDGERAFISDFASLLDFDESMVMNHWDCIENSSVVCLVGLFNLPNFSMDGVLQLMKMAKEAGKVTMLDTGWDPEGWPKKTIKDIKGILKHINIFMPNLDEAHAITGNEDIAESIFELLGYGPELIVVKCGPDGVSAGAGDKRVRLPARPVKVHDAVGAGDVFNAGFLFGFGNGWSLETCLAYGNSAASLYISREIERFPELEEVAETANWFDQFLLG
jgi:sugar/nucleoside kinase (ribokinase family)